MNNKRDEEIKSLIEELQELQLRIGVVSHRLRTLESDNNRNERTRARRSKREKEVGSIDNTGSDKEESILFEVEDIIRVKNPSKGQVDRGIVTGYRKNGYISITLDNGIKTCRDKKNLELIEKSSK